MKITENTLKDLIDNNPESACSQFPTDVIRYIGDFELVLKYNPAWLCNNFPFFVPRSKLDILLTHNLMYGVLNYTDLVEELYPDKLKEFILRYGNMQQNHFNTANPYIGNFDKMFPNPFKPANQHMGNFGDGGTDINMFDLKGRWLR
jgi:hypothetical protein